MSVDRMVDWNSPLMREYAVFASARVFQLQEVNESVGDPPYQWTRYGFRWMAVPHDDNAGIPTGAA